MFEPQGFVKYEEADKIQNLVFKIYFLCKCIVNCSQLSNHNSYVFLVKPYSIFIGISLKLPL